jgi:hypothetical protein
MGRESGSQGDQIGPVSASKAIVEFGQFGKFSKVAQIFGYFYFKN